MDKAKNKVQQNVETGLIKVKRKKRRKRGNTSDKNLVKNLNRANKKLNSTLVLTSDSSLEDSKQTNKGKVDDAEIMTFFTLPAEYAFVARAISQMDRVGKGLDANFDFVSASAPYLIETKGGEKYILDEGTKFVLPILKWQNVILKVN